MIRSLAESTGESLAERIAAFAHTGVVVDELSGAGEQLGLSRFGGHALLPPARAWPNADVEDANGNAAPEEDADRLVAVIDLAAVGPLDPDGLLPHHGVLNFFATCDDENGQVIHADPATAVRTPPPEGVTRYEEQPLYGRTVLTVPDMEDLRRLDPDLLHEIGSVSDGANVLRSYKSIAENDGGSSCHNLIGGWPGWAQSTLFVGGGKEHLLFDLQGDGGDLTFGDSGSLYFLIEERDLRAGHLDNAHAELHSL